MNFKKLLSLLLLTLIVLSGCSTAANTSTDPKTGITYDYDVIVVGADPEGIVAAVSSARNGLKTLLIEESHEIGGLMTLGKLNFIDLCEDREGNLLTKGLFEEFYKAVGGTAYEIDEALEFFHSWIDDEKNITLKLNTKFKAPILDGTTITGITVTDENNEEVNIYARRIIDATVDADVAAASNVPYTVGWEDIGEADQNMGVTLVFELSGVNWDKVTDYLNNDDNPNTGATAKSAWGYSTEGYSYVPKDTLMKLRGFNVAKQKNGNVLINSLIIFGVDPLDNESKENGIKRANEELKYILPYVNENFVGFENAKLVSTAEELYVRESRHIIGEYVLTIDDVLENKDQWDKIAIVAYPVDMQPTAQKPWGNVIGRPNKYAIPFRSIVPTNVQNMLVIGRSASYSSMAAGSARVISVGMAEGQAAGVACAYSIKNDISFTDISKDEKAIKKIQKTLVKQKAYLEDFEITEPPMDHWAYSGLKTIRSIGLMAGGYSNDYGLDNATGVALFNQLIFKTLSKAGIEMEYLNLENPPTNELMLNTICSIVSIDETDYTKQIEKLNEIGIIDDVTKTHMGKSDEIPTNAVVIMIGANLYNQALVGKLNK